jgi:hypothetical protein
MPSKLLLTAALVISTAVFGQDQSSIQATSTQSTSPAPVNGPFGGPILVTPSAGFPNPAPAAGISDAGRAGISIGTNSTAPAEAAAGTAATSSVPTTAGVEPSTALTNEPAAPASDLIPSTSAGRASETAPAGVVSLAEISGRYKAEKSARSARVLGNDDVEKMLANKGGVTMAKNMPPLGSGALEQGGQPQTAATPSGAQSASASQQGQSNATSQGETPQPASSAGQSAASDTSAENSTTPQINQRQQSNDAQGSRRLPATAGFLPLLGLLGLVSGGIGYCFRKFRK